jgi:hypothetical protein
VIEIERATKSAADSAPLTISHRAAAFLRYRIYRTRFFANNATSFLLVRLNLEMIQFFLYFFFLFSLFAVNHRATSVQTRQLLLSLFINRICAYIFRYTALEWRSKFFATNMPDQKTIKTVKKRK